MDARDADNGVWEPGTERAHLIRQRAGSPKIPDRLTRIEPDLAVVGTVKDSSAGGVETYHQRIKIAEQEPFWEPDRSIGTELRRTQSGEVAKF